MAHTFTHHLYHIIFSTKDRQATILPEFQRRLYEYIGGIARKRLGHALAIGGTSDHVHVLLSLHAPIAVPQAVVKLKSFSSGWLN